MSRNEIWGKVFSFRGDKSRYTLRRCTVTPYCFPKHQSCGSPGRREGLDPFIRSSGVGTTLAPSPNESGECVIVTANRPRCVFRSPSELYSVNISLLLLRVFHALPGSWRIISSSSLLKLERMTTIVVRTRTEKSLQLRVAVVDCN